MIAWLAWWLYEHPEQDIGIDLSDDVTYWMILGTEIVFLLGALACLILVLT